MGDERLHGPDTYTEDYAHFYDLQVAQSHKAEEIGHSSIGTPIPTSPLPPSPTVSSTTSPNGKISCQVCGDTSSGLHFGVYTCEGCKCFYRRSIREGARYICSKTGSCCITPDTRNTCRYCRFYRCLALGMSPEGIKLGRRPKLESRQPVPVVEYKDIYSQEFSMRGLKMKLKRATKTKLYHDRWTNPYTVTGWHSSTIHPGTLLWHDNSTSGNFALKSSENIFSSRSCAEVPSQGVQQIPDLETEQERNNIDESSTGRKTEACDSHNGVYIKEEDTSTPNDEGTAGNGVETRPLLYSPPVSPTLPEVIYGAAQALAFANMYRQDDRDTFSYHESYSHNSTSPSETGLS